MSDGKRTEFVRGLVNAVISAIVSFITARGWPF